MPVDCHLTGSEGFRSFRLLVGAVVAVIAFVLAGLLLSCMGCGVVESLLLAALSALVVGFLVERERAQYEKVELLERQHAAALEQFELRINTLYSDSVACLISFDASSLVIDRVSRGFFDLMGFSTNRNLVGMKIDEVLSIEPTRLKAVVSGLKVGIVDIRETLVCKQVDGRSIPLIISGCYRHDLQLVEIAFFYRPREAKELNESERAFANLSRFQQGVLRRENRILALKTEVNQLLTGSGGSARYKVDALSDDARYSRQLAQANRNEAER